MTIRNINDRWGDAVNMGSVEEFENGIMLSGYELPEGGLIEGIDYEILKEITYYASNDSMGDTSTEDCNKFRAWAFKSLKKEYQNHAVRVSSSQSMQTIDTDDEENREEIEDFCSRLWDNCPWD